MNMLRPLKLHEVREVFDEDQDVIGCHCYIEHVDFGITRAIIDYCDGGLIGVFSSDPRTFLYQEEYGITWRCWLALPSHEDRLRYPW